MRLGLVGECELRLIGLGAAVRLQTTSARPAVDTNERRSTYMVHSASTSYRGSL